MDGPENYRAAADILRSVGGVNAAAQSDIPALLVAAVHAIQAQTAATVAAAREDMYEQDWDDWQQALGDLRYDTNLNDDRRRPADELDQHEVNILRGLVSRFDDSV